MGTSGAYDVVLAHEGLLHALPFFLPALLVVAVLGAVVWRDRHAPPEDEDAAPGAASRRGSSTDGQ